MWLRRCKNHKNATALIFARTDTAAWMYGVWENAAHSVLFLYDRLYFHHQDGRVAKHNAGAPSALVAYNRENTRKLEGLSLPGKMVYLK